MKEYTKEFLISLYEKMIEIRMCEERFVEPILKGDIVCPVHLCSGQEAIAVGACAALSEDDSVFGGHRSHGHFLAKGGELKALVAEIYGKETGCSKGRGGSMHVIDHQKGMLGAAPIVAGTISLAVGAALSSASMNEKKVSISFFGDGATGEGVLYESMNLAKIHRLPVIFICENNLYSTHMPISKIRPNVEIHRVAEPLDITSMVVYGNNVLEVFEVVKNAREKCLNREGPVFIECKTYRMRGHVGPDDNIQGVHTDIRPKEEIKRWKEKDPILKFEKYLMGNKILNKTKILALQDSVMEKIDAAFDFALKSPYPPEEEVMKYVFK